MEKQKEHCDGCDDFFNITTMISKKGEASQFFCDECKNEISTCPNCNKRAKSMDIDYLGDGVYQCPNCNMKKHPTDDEVRDYMERHNADEVGQGDNAWDMEKARYQLELDDEYYYQEELNESELHEIARLIVGGYTSGILDNDGYRVSWDLKVEKFKN